MGSTFLLRIDDKFNDNVRDAMRKRVEEGDTQVTEPKLVNTSGGN